MLLAAYPWQHNLKPFFLEPSFIDVMSTPSLNKNDKTSGSSFFRTPGQVMSLTSNFTFVSIHNFIFQFILLSAVIIFAQEK